MAAKPMIIEAAVNGGFTMKAHNPHVPYTPQEIAADAIAAVDAGATVIHLHARMPDGSRVPTAAGLLAQYQETFRLIRAARQPLIYPTFPVGDPDRPLKPSTDPEPRFRHFRDLARDPGTRSDLGAFDAGSVNIPMYDADAKTVKSPNHTYVNSFETVRYFVAQFRALNIPASLNIFEPGFLRTALTLNDIGILPEPLVLRLYFSEQFGLPPSRTSIAAYREMLGVVRCEWFGACIEGDIRPHLDLFAREGGHVRVGLEDYTYENAGKPSNADLVAQAAAAARAAGRPVANVEETRSLLGAA